MNSELKNAMWLLMKFDINRYLMSNADGRWDGAEKSDRHTLLCNTFIAVWYEVDHLESAWLEFDDGLERYEAVHDGTQALTSYLDSEIGFPLEGRPDYDQLAPAFFERFIDLAIKAVKDFK